MLASFIVPKPKANARKDVVHEINDVPRQLTINVVHRILKRAKRLPEEDFENLLSFAFHDFENIRWHFLGDAKNIHPYWLVKFLEAERDRMYPVKRLKTAPGAVSTDELSQIASEVRALGHQAQQLHLDMVKMQQTMLQLAQLAGMPINQASFDM